MVNSSLSLYLSSEWLHCWVTVRRNCWVAPSMSSVTLWTTSACGKITPTVGLAECVLSFFTKVKLRKSPNRTANEINCVIPSSPHQTLTPLRHAPHPATTTVCLKTQSVSGQYRILVKGGGYVWAETHSAVIPNNRTRKFKSTAYLQPCVLSITYILRWVCVCTLQYTDLLVVSILQSAQKSHVKDAVDLAFCLQPSTETSVFLRVVLKCLAGRQTASSFKEGWGQCSGGRGWDDPLLGYLLHFSAKDLIWF